MSTDANTDSDPTDSVKYCHACKKEIHSAYGVWVDDAGTPSCTRKTIHYPKRESIWEMYKNQDPARQKRPLAMLALDLGVGVFLFFMMILMIGGALNFVATHF